MMNAVDGKDAEGFSTPAASSPSASSPSTSTLDVIIVGAGVSALTGSK